MLHRLSMLRRPLLPRLNAITAAHRDHHIQYQMFHLFTLVGIPSASIMAFGPSRTKITRLCVLYQIMHSIPNCPCEPPFSLRPPAARHAYSIAAAAATAVPPITAFDGAPQLSSTCFPFLNPEFVTHDTDGSIFEIWKQKMRHWHSRGSNRRSQGNGRRSASGNGNAHPPHRSSTPAPQGNSTGLTHTLHVAATPAQPSAPSSTPHPGPTSTAAPAMRYGPAYSNNTNPNARQPGTFVVQPNPTP